MKKISLFILTLSVIFSNINVSAANIGDKTISSKGAFVMDYTTGRVVLDVISNSADGIGESFHIDSTGENEGTWVSTTAAAAGGN